MAASDATDADSRFAVLRRGAPIALSAVANLALAAYATRTRPSGLWHLGHGIGWAADFAVVGLAIGLCLRLLACLSPIPARLGCLALGSLQLIALAVAFVYVHEFDHLPNQSTLDFIERYPAYSFTMAVETLGAADWLALIAAAAATAGLWWWASRGYPRDSAGIRGGVLPLLLAVVASAGAHLNWGAAPARPAELHHPLLLVERGLTGGPKPEGARIALEPFELNRLRLHPNEQAGGTAPSAEPKDVPNLIVFRLEEVSRSHFGLYDSELGNTPRLARLRERHPHEFFLFRHHFASSGATDTALMTLYTGLAPTRSGREFGHFPLLWDYARYAGYATFLAIPFDASWGDLGERWQSAPGELQLDAFLHAGNANRQLVYDQSMRDDDVVTLSLLQIDEILESGGPFLGIVSLKLPHANGRGVERVGYETTACAREGRLLSNYDCGIYDNDFQIGRVLALLQKRGILRDTVIFGIADHGADQRLRRNRLYNYYSEVLDVPFFAYVPERFQGRLDLIAPAWRENVHRPTSHVDFVPTLVTLMGIADDPQVAFALQDLDGFNLFDALPEERWIAAMNTNGLREWQPEGFALVIDGRHKFIYDDGAEYLFDLELDPGEERNLLPASTREHRRLYLRVQDYIQSRRNMRRVYAMEQVRAGEAAPGWSPLRASSMQEPRAETVAAPSEAARDRLDESADGRPESAR